MTLLIDPPSGWRYGFPKFYNNPEGKPLAQWLLENGYPQHEIDNGGLHVRYLGTREELDTLRNSDGMFNESENVE